MSSGNNSVKNWINPKKVTAEEEVEYLVVTVDECFYTAFFNPLGFDGWIDIARANDQPLEVVLYQALPDAEALVNEFIYNVKK